MKISAALPIGVAALLFDSARRRREAEVRMVQHLRGQGYSEVILPILDFVEPYETMLTPAARNELYRFVDRDGELLALRADFTPMLARLLAPRIGALDLPLRLFYRGDVIRYEEERAGRQREFYQVGAEVLGVPGEPAEAEALRLFLELLGPAEGQAVQVILSFAGALDELLLEAGVEDPVRLAQAVARRDRGEVRRAGGSLLTILRTGLPENPEELGGWRADRLRLLLDLRNELATRFPAARFCVDLAEFARHGLDPRLSDAAGERSYYDGLVFRAYAGPGATPVGAGGRYDRLFRALGADVPAAGFSIHLERLLEARSRAEGGRP